MEAAVRCAQICNHARLALHLHGKMPRLLCWASLRLASPRCLLCLLHPAAAHWSALPALTFCSPLPSLRSRPPPSLPSDNNDFVLHCGRRQRGLTSKRMVSRAYHDSLFMAQAGFCILFLFINFILFTQLPDQPAHGPWPRWGVIVAFYFINGCLTSRPIWSAARTTRLAVHGPGGGGCFMFINHQILMFLCSSSTSNATRQPTAASNESCRSFPRCKAAAAALVGNVVCVLAGCTDASLVPPPCTDRAHRHGVHPLPQRLEPPSG